ncbi:MAG: MBL fold metallo-hydrolase [Acidimicrobiia bacterium]
MGTMKFTVLGSNAGAPSPSNPGSGYLVQTSSTSIWMDAGPGTFAALSQIMDPRDIDGMVLSHTHIDHCVDALGMFAYLEYGLGGGRTMDVYAPQGTTSHLAAFVRADADHVFHRRMKVREVGSGDTGGIGDVELAFGDAVHPVPAMVTRMTGEGSSMVYSGDTGPGGDLIEMATGVDLLLVEAALQGVRDQSTYPFHLTAREGGEIASMAGVNQLVLTHINFTKDVQLSIDQASSAFVGPIEYAAPQSVFEME